MVVLFNYVFDSMDYSLITKNKDPIYFLTQYGMVNPEQGQYIVYEATPRSWLLEI